MIAIIPPTRTTPPSSSPPSGARVALRSPTSRGLLDGAWWPHSRDLTVELPELVDVLDPLWGRITRVAVNPMLWPVVPRKVTVGQRVVKTGWFTPELDPHTLLLLSYGTRRFDLLVIPPETSAACADRLMVAACAPDGPRLSATDLVAAETARLRGAAVIDRPQISQTPQISQGSRENEGGATSTHVGPTVAGR
ncbi:DUF5994 family protein [Streptomyces sp. NBC_00006]|uniref:DUF5994 family protein n=1 Tax=Streptomyces sp. NBC_00006 TaxID=2975619 RepID=UPI002254512F|nr:DUF5994 family protein [Streptomyces sp. NBC_00006]MCX5529315.1 DUF5994 family protein [Streptomyces sp. NBC_00006]